MVPTAPVTTLADVALERPGEHPSPQPGPDQGSDLLALKGRELLAVLRESELLRVSELLSVHLNGQLDEVALLAHLFCPFVEDGFIRRS
jgi:hypothetical protein